MLTKMAEQLREVDTEAIERAMLDQVVAEWRAEMREAGLDPLDPAVGKTVIFCARRFLAEWVPAIEEDLGGSVDAETFGEWMTMLGVVGAWIGEEVQVA